MVENVGIEELEKHLNQTNTLKVISLKFLIDVDIRDFEYCRVQMGCKYWRTSDIIWPSIFVQNLYGKLNHPL